MNDASDRDARDAMDRLAELLRDPEGLRVARLLQRAGLFDRREEGATAPPSAASSEPNRSDPAAGQPRPISIWRPRRRGSELVFVRPEPGPFGDHYAARREIPAAKPDGRRRVCWFGESAAAGYLYAPHLTPAQLLAAHLDAASGAGSWEVVDLARTNEKLGSLVATVEASLQLDPDALVVYAGNNWTLLETPERSPYAPSVGARQRYADELRRDGLYGPIEGAAYALVQRAGAALAAIGRLAGAAAVPVVMVVPEVNLADWEERQPVPWLPGEGAARWHRHLEEAQRHLRARRWHELAREAAEMLALDDGVCSTSYRLVARARLGLGDEAGAAEAGRAEVAAVHYATLGFLAAPRASPLVQELLRRAARAHGFGCADLPAVFAAQTGSPLPGRRLFLDYCHLTVEGMRVATAAAAAEVLRRLAPDGEAPGWRDLLARTPAPTVSPAADATAKLGAAIHSAHRLLAVGDKAPILEHWCREAVAASPGIEVTMLDLVAIRTAYAAQAVHASRCPAVLTAAQHRIHASPYRLTHQHGLAYDYLDHDLIAAIVAVLEERGKPARAEVDRRLVGALQARGADGRGVDLAHPPFFLAEPLERFFPEVLDHADLTGTALFRAAWPESGFCLVADGASGHVLELVARLPPLTAGDAPPAPRRGRAVLRLNGEALGEVDLGQRWRRATLAVPARRLRAGVNRLTFRWPVELPPGEAALAAAADRLELGIEADLHPVFAEVASLIVRRDGTGADSPRSSGCRPPV